MISSPDIPGPPGPDSPWWERLMIVEFIGAPGSGKTSLVPTAVDALRACGIEAYSVVDGARPFTARTMLGRIVRAWAPARLEDALLWRLFLFMSAAGRWRSRSEETALLNFVRTTQQRRPPAAEAERRRVLPWLWQLRGVNRFLGRYGKGRLSSSTRVMRTASFSSLPRTSRPPTCPPLRPT